jgi:hypothetical protein
MEQFLYFNIYKQYFKLPYNNYNNKCNITIYTYLLYVYIGSINLVAADVVVMETETSTEFIDNQYDELIAISTNKDLESPIETHKNTFGNECMYNE